MKLLRSFTGGYCLFLLSYTSTAFDVSVEFLLLYGADRFHPQRVLEVFLEFGERGLVVAEHVDRKPFGEPFVF